jgi:transglutaminase-like putative cysteine protease
MKWGEPTEEQLAMSSFPADSNANAVVLCDYGTITFSAELNIVFKRHVRIKILNKAAYDAWGTHRVSYYAKEGTQRLKDLAGMTITRDEKGSVVHHELDDDAIFKEEYDNGMEEVRFTLPSLSPGCIVEFRYTIVSEGWGFMPEWTFQGSEPTLWSELRLTCPSFIAFGIVWEGYERFSVQEQEEVHLRYIVAGIEGVYKASYQRWVVRDAPAIREEPFMTTVNDYVMKIKFQLSSYAQPGFGVKNYLNTWEKLVEELNDDREFGKRLRESSDIRKQSSAITAGLADPLAKMKAIYDNVRSTIVWNEKEQWYSKKDLDDVLTEKKGNSAEINLLLISMLRASGLTAHPVLISTRSNGKVQKLYPIYTQFDYVLGLVKIGEKEMLLDATDRLRPYWVLPRRALNHVGLVIEEGQSHRWIDIVPASKAIVNTVAVVQLSAEGELRGEVDKLYSDYSAADQRRAQNKTTDAEYIKDVFETTTSGISVDSFAIAMRDSTAKPLGIRAKISAAQYAQSLNDFLYVNPMISVRMTESSLKLARRTFPVDFAVGSESSFSLELRLPEGYDVKEMPKDAALTLPANGGSYSRKCQVSGNVFQMRVRVERNQLYFQPREYAGLKLFFDKRIALESEQLVLQKRAQPVQVPESKPGKKPTSKGRK